MKKVSWIIICLVFLITLFNCNNRRNNIFVNKTIADTSCSTLPYHPYSRYVPSHEISCNSMPLIIVIDPHGSGKSAIKNLIPAAEKYKCVLVASNLIKNNYHDYQRSIQQLINEARSKYPVNDFVLICGFSGGARMAISFSQNNHVDGILACGALASAKELTTSKADIYSIMGMTDFNFREIAQYIINTETKPANFHFEIAGELHEWPASEVLSSGIGFLICKSKNFNACLSRKVILKELEDSCLIETDRLLKSNEFIKASLIYFNLINLNEKKSIQKNLTSLLNNKLYIIEIQQFEKYLQFEMKLCEAYQNALFTYDAIWWANEIASLNSQIENSTNKYEQVAFKRTKAFLGILCYSSSRNSLQNNDLKNVEKILAVYKLIEPQNPDMFYFSALYYLKLGKPQQSKELIIKSLGAGFQDTSLIKNNFPKDLVDQIF